jgi:ATP-dependent RNA helicase HelY
MAERRRTAAEAASPLTPSAEDFERSYGFSFDPFQRTACNALLDGSSVLVAAPTGAGKTVVGEFAAWLAMRRGGKTFYTTPIKALSNQKFGDFSELHGPSNVGLLTGDNSINGDASIVVMTTETLITRM